LLHGGHRAPTVPLSPDNPRQLPVEASPRPPPDRSLPRTTGLGGSSRADTGLASFVSPSLTSSSTSTLPGSRRLSRRKRCDPPRLPAARCAEDARHSIPDRVRPRRAQRPSAPLLVLNDASHPPLSSSAEPTWTLRVAWISDPWPLPHASGIGPSPMDRSSAQSRSPAPRPRPRVRRCQPIAAPQHTTTCRGLFRNFRLDPAQVSTPPNKNEGIHMMCG
jgi:hypothetical protein